ncbi:MAG TPA: type IVB secretion system protein IcmH/DotU, partial [Acetobacteraceae bacterium]|nr:type IVB secretion system protein IcmH/DotU [Acetobacteraceae bacterium]
MSDNPFSKPDDFDRTVIRPVPGGRRAAPAAPSSQSAFGDTAPPARHGAAAAITAEGAEKIRFGANPLIEAAAPLLQLLGRLRNTYSQPNPAELRERAIQEVRGFEQAARNGGVPIEQVRPAHYALCASLDDVVLNTPWGSSGAWAARSLVSTFHQEVRSGERFFDLLRQMCQTPGTFLPVIELMYLCMSL